MLTFAANRVQLLTSKQEIKMNIEDLTIKQARELVAIFSSQTASAFDNGMIGKYVIARCRDAGVHAGYLKSHNGRECVLSQSRRLWYWKPLNNASNLSGVAVHGLHSSSKIGEPINVHLTENCEIIECSKEAAISISGMKSYEQ